MSAGPPGANGTMTRTGRLGYDVTSSAYAPVPKDMQAAANTAPANNFLIRLPFNFAFLQLGMFAVDSMRTRLLGVLPPGGRPAPSPRSG
jgi:hypothetical protein